MPKIFSSVKYFTQCFLTGVCLGAGWTAGSILIDKISKTDEK